MVLRPSQVTRAVTAQLQNEHESGPRSTAVAAVDRRRVWRELDTRNTRVRLHTVQTMRRRCTRVTTPLRVMSFSSHEDRDADVLANLLAAILLRFPKKGSSPPCMEYNNQC